MEKYQILYDLSFAAIHKLMMEAYEDALPKLRWISLDAKKVAKKYKHFPYERGGYYIEYSRWLVRKEWHFFTHKIAFHKRGIDGDVPLIMRLVSDKDGNRYAAMMRVTEDDSGTEIFLFSLHFLRRYALRQLADETAATEDVMHLVAEQFVDPLRYITTGRTYGTNESRVCLTLGIGDGIAFGYKDIPARIVVVDTFIHRSQLGNNQHHVFDYLHSEAEDNEANLYPLVIENGEYRPMKEEELLEYLEKRDNPEYQQKISDRNRMEGERNRRRWERKSLRSADSVQVKRPQYLPKAKAREYDREFE